MLRPRPIRAEMARCAAAVCLSGLAALAAAAESPSRPRPAPLVEAVDPGGAPLADLAPGDLEVRVAGERVAVEALEPAPEPWRIVLYLDQRLSDLLFFRTAAFELAALAEELVARGPVEVVLADEQARTAFPPTRDASALAEALSWIMVREAAYPEQVALRQAFVEELGQFDAADWVRADAGRRLAELGAGVRQAIADESELLQRQRGLLVEWLLEQEDGEPGLLVLAAGGFDAAPERFYRQLLEGTPAAEALAGLETEEPSPTVDEVAEALAVAGWTVTAFSPPAAEDPLLVETEDEARRRAEDKMVETTMQDGRLVDKTTVGIDPRKVFAAREDEAAEAPRARLLEASAPLAALASAAGGEMLTERRELGDALARLPHRRRLVLDAPPASGGVPRRLTVELASRRGTVRAPAWLGPGTPRAVSAVRAERVLRSEETAGELELAAALTEDRESGETRLAVRLDGAVPTPARPLRLTVAVDRQEGGADIRHFHLDGSGDPPVAAGDDGSLRIDLPVAGRDAEAPVAVVAEELAAGRWGAAVAEERYDALGEAAESLILPAPKTIHLMAPRAAMVMGRTTFDTVVSEQRVDRVEFYLDGERVASSYSPPHSAVIDLGKLPETHVLEAVAFSAGGEELDRDRLTLNEGTGSFRVRIRDPRGPGRRRGALVTGPVEVGAEVRVPRGASLDRLEFYWNDELVGTRFAPPYRQRIDVPAADPRGFVRVVGHLADGSSSEDVLLLNSPGEAERLDVELVELYVVVTDRQGRPVKDLGRDRFVVREEGSPRQLATFGDAGDLPLTVGLAIDSSASMFVKLAEVQAAAADYVRGLAEPRDRAFVVGFGGEPRLARDTTADLTQVLNGLYRLEPEGATAIWKAVVYSLVQLQGVPGKKALIVYSDGADEDPDFSYRTALRFARRVGVPVYFIVSNDEIYRTGGKGLNVRGFMGRLEKLAAEVGGRVYLTRVNEDLDEIYREIDEELRSQYLVGYYVDDLGEERWREVEVEVDVPGAKARTVAGYYR